MWVGNWGHMQGRVQGLPPPVPHLGGDGQRAAEQLVLLLPGGGGVQQRTRQHPPHPQLHRPLATAAGYAYSGGCGGGFMAVGPQQLLPHLRCQAGELLGGGGEA